MVGECWSWSRRFSLTQATQKPSVPVCSGWKRPTLSSRTTKRAAACWRGVGLGIQTLPRLPWVHQPVCARIAGHG